MSPEATEAPDLEGAIRALGERLGGAMAPLIEAAGGAAAGPQRVAEALGVDKVLASRLLKSLRTEDPVSRLHHSPGPDPLRRAIKGARRRLGADAAAVSAALSAVDDFETFLADRIGDRSALTSLLAAWSPEVRQEFELRRKQAAWRAVSELRGVSVDLDVSSVLIHPSRRTDRLDVTWLLGLIGLRRLRPGVTVEATTQRITEDGDARRPLDLDGAPLRDRAPSQLIEFCTHPPARIRAERTGDLLRYVLAGDDYGPGAEADLLLAEVNEAELVASVPPGSGRRAWFYADVTTPAKKLVLDVVLHRDVYPGAAPELLLYDTASKGIADVNDRSRDPDRLDLFEHVRTLERGLDDIALREFPHHERLLAHVLERRGLRAEDFAVHRVEIDYPLHGMQVSVAFAAPERSVE